mgnify:CR=1 FL=1
MKNKIINKSVKIFCTSLLLLVISVSFVQAEVTLALDASLETQITERESRLQKDGLNTFIDPKNHPLYGKQSHTIFFKKDQVTLQEMYDFQELIDFINIDKEPTVMLDIEADNNEISLKNDLNTTIYESAERGLTPNSKLTTLTYYTEANNTKTLELDYYLPESSIVKSLAERKEVLQDRTFVDLLPMSERAVMVQYKKLKENKEGERLEKNEATLEDLQPQVDKIKAKESELQAKIDQEMNEISEKIDTYERIIAENKNNWDGKRAARSQSIDEVALSVDRIEVVDMGELIDSIYPTEEEVNDSNQRILDIRNATEEFNLDRIWRREEFISKISSWFTTPFVRAEYLSNFVGKHIIYPRATGALNLRFDLKGNNVNNHTEFQLYPANGGNAQKFKMIDETGEIKYAANTGYCIDRAGGGYGNGVKVQLYQCNGSPAQRWVAYPDDGTIRPLHNTAYCLDASAGLNANSTIHLWQCHGGSNQTFQIGEEDFGKFDYFIRLHAKEGPGYIPSQPSFYGHAFVSMPKKDRSTHYWHITNSFGFWKDSAQQDTHNSNNSKSRTNNMRNKRSDGSYSSLHIDNGLQDKDWDNARLNPADLGGVFNQYKRTTSAIDKVSFEEIKYMRGYQINNPIQGGNYVNSNWAIGCTHCASYAAQLWNKYNRWNDPDYGQCSLPSQLKNAM